MRNCGVASCVAAAVTGSKFCGPHTIARTAKELRLGPDKEGLGAATCAKCWRRFKDEDFVSRAPIDRLVRAKAAAGWVHVSCAPAAKRPTREQIRESVKPLLDAGDAGGRAVAGREEPK